MKNKPLTMLVIDDDEAVVQHMAAILHAEYGCRVDTAYNGKEGYDSMKNFSPERYGLVLLEVLVPALNGVEVCQMMIEDEVLKRTKVILMSELPLRSEAFRRSLHTYDEFSVVAGILEKPFDKEELLKRVDLVLNQD